MNFAHTGWFARDPSILRRVGHVLLQLPYADSRAPRHIIIADDCFQLLKSPKNRVAQVVIRSTEKLFGSKFYCVTILVWFLLWFGSTLSCFLFFPPSSWLCRRIGTYLLLFNVFTFLGQVLNSANLGDYLAAKVPSLKQFHNAKRNGELKLSSLQSLANAMLLLKRWFICLFISFH